MLNTINKTTKGNKTQDKRVIPFYTKEAFPSENKKEEDDDVVATIEMVSLKLKIDKTKGEGKMNTYSRQVKSLSNFHTDNIKHPME